MASELTTSEICERYGVSKKEALLLSVLLDGKTHSKADLQKTAFGGRANCDGLIPQHIYRMRPKLTALGIVIDGVGRGRSARGWKLIARKVPA